MNPQAPPNHRRAMLHILAYYERDRRRLARQDEATRHFAASLAAHSQDSQRQTAASLPRRKAMIHIMGTPETTANMPRREHRARDTTRSNSFMRGKLATLGN